LEAIDAATGNTRWHVDRDEVTTWNTPLVVEAAGRTQVIVNGSNRARSYDLATGKEIWACGGQVTNPIPSPVANGKLAFCMTGYQGSEIYAIPLDAEGDITGSDKIAWHGDEGAPYVPSPLLVDNRLYFTKGNSGILSCLDATTGERVIEQVRVPGLGDVYASPVGAAGRIYLTGRGGTTVVIRQGDELEVLATHSLGESVDASPAVVGDALLIRTAGHLYCVAEEEGIR
jgi:outer membrane protein assembly factor BamB